VSDAVSDLEHVFSQSFNLDHSAFNNRLLPKITTCKSRLAEVKDEAKGSFEKAAQYTLWLEQMVVSHALLLSLIEEIVERKSKTFFTRDAQNFLSYMEKLFVLSNSCLSDEKRKVKMEDLLKESKDRGVDETYFKLFALSDMEPKAEVFFVHLKNVLQKFEHIWCFVAHCKDMDNCDPRCLFEHIRSKKDEDFEVVEVAKALMQVTLLVHMIVKYLPENEKTLNYLTEKRKLWSNLYEISLVALEFMQEEYGSTGPVEEDIDYSQLLV